MPYILSDRHDKRAGNKARSLAALFDLGLHVPDWVVVQPAGFFQCLTVAQRRLLARLAHKLQKRTLTRGEQDQIKEILAAIQISDALRSEITSTLNERFPDTKAFAVRSSAQDEDGAEHSFAGQFETFLGVPAWLVADRVLDVWRSGFSERVQSYRSQTDGLLRLPSIPAVIVQKMVAADVSGVAFSANPVTGDVRVSIVEAVRGLGEGLVSGLLDADRWSISAGEVQSEYVARKEMHLVQSPNGGTQLTAIALPNEEILSKDQILEISSTVRKIADASNCPQDIEWCICDNQLFVLQARAITTIVQTRETAGEDGVLCFDNSNIQESYPGITTPLTFSFARKAYENVYRQFLKIMGVSAADIEDHADVYPRMLALVQGRMYYNLASWFDLLALLPGFGSNRAHMETMMGLRQPVPDAVRTPVGRKTTPLSLLRTSLFMLFGFATLGQTSARFEQRVKESLSIRACDLKQMNPAELSAHYRQLEKRLLTKWDAPLVNDFFAMIFYGLLKKLCSKWLAENSSVENLLVSSTGGIISAEPAHRIKHMAKLAAGSEEFVNCLCSGELSEIQTQIDKRADFKAEYLTYIDLFADRCLEELKLETPTLADNPLLLLRSIGQVARNNQVETTEQSPPPVDEARDILARLNPFRRIILTFVLNQTRDLIRRRENLRFVRTTIFGRVRRIFAEIGKRFASAGVLQDERDIFYLEVEEILGHLQGTAGATCLADIAAARRTQFAHWSVQKEPPGRILTTTSQWLSGQFGDLPDLQFARASRSSVDAGAKDEQLAGTACSPGRVRGKVRVVIDPSTAHIEAGEILVAKRTDPGWVMLFPAAAGLIVEHGSLLSHSAIVSRELRLPSVVGVHNATSTLVTGDEIELNGSTGEILIICRAGIESQARVPQSQAAV